MAVGVDANWGGAIVKLSFGPDHPNTAWYRNVVNNGLPDTGRSIQTALYTSGLPGTGDEYPTCWACDEQCPRWGWQPVQAGSCAQASGYLSVDASPEHITVVTQPLHWDPENGRSNVLIEQTLRFVRPNVVQIDYTYTNNEGFTIGGHSLEVPDAYLESYMNRAFTYRGTEPFTNQPVEQMTVPVGNRLLDPFQATEGWIALADQRGWAVAVYTPPVHHSWLFQNLSGDESPTHLMQIFSYVAIPPGHQVTHRSFLITGQSIGEVRAAVYELRGDPQTPVQLLCEPDGCRAGAGPPPPPGGGVPTAPSDLRALPVVGQHTMVALTWHDRSTNEEGFRVHRLRSGEPAWESIGSVGADQSSFSDDVAQLPAGGTSYYFYKVEAFNRYGASVSDRAEARLYDDAPGVADVLRPRGCIENLVPLLSWRSGERSSQFYVRLLDARSGEPAMADATPAMSSVPVSVPLVAGTPYMLRVWGMNNVGWGPGSAPEFFMPFCGSFAPPTILEPSGCVGTLTPLVRWTEVSGALSYHLRIFEVVDIGSDREVIVGGVGTTLPEWQVPAGLLQPGREYRIKVKPHTGGDEVGYSRHRFFTPLCAADQLPGTASPIAPIGSTTSTAQPIYLFEPAARTELYTLEVWLSGWQLVVQEQLSASSCEPQLCSRRPAVTLNDGMYHWRVRAHNAHGNGIWGPWATFIVANVPPELSVSDPSVVESAGTARFDIRLSRPAPSPASVRFATVAGTAQTPADFKAVAGTVMLVDGQQQASVDVPLVADGVYERAESFALRLSEPQGAVVRDGEGVATVLDDDPPPRLAIDDVALAEGDADVTEVALTVTLVGATEVDASVRFEAANCTAIDGEDHGASPADLLSFPVGVTHRTVSAKIFGDTGFEGHEVFRGLLSAPSDASIDDGAGQVTIRNDDPPGFEDPRPLPPRFDLDGDGEGDLLWRHQLSNRLVVWYLDGPNRLAGELLRSAAFPDAGWSMAGNGDFDEDGRADDLLWQNTGSGSLAVWFMDGADHTGGEILAGAEDLGWGIAGTGDLDGNGSTDLVWRHETSGELMAWLLRGIKLVEQRPIDPPQLTDLQWQIAAVADLSGDHQPDLLWRHRVSGALVVWTMAGLVRTGGFFLTPDRLTDLNWRLVGAWDVDRDGDNDLLWHHRLGGDLMVWYLDGTSQRCAADLDPDGAADVNWLPVGPR